MAEAKQFIVRLEDRIAEAEAERADRVEHFLQYEEFETLKDAEARLKAVRSFGIIGELYRLL